MFSVTLLTQDASLNFVEQLLNIFTVSKHKMCDIDDYFRTLEVSAMVLTYSKGRGYSQTKTDGVVAQ